MGETTNTTPPVDLAAENAALKARIAELEAKQAEQAKDEDAIVQLTSKGLTRQQAIAKLQRQRAFDADQAKTKAERLVKLLQLVKGSRSAQEAVDRARVLMPYASASVILAEIEEAKAAQTK